MMNNRTLYKPFLERHRLTEAYLEQAEQRFAPLIDDVLAQLAVEAKNAPKQALVIGINGCQGSGKSTLADYICTTLVLVHNIETISVSLDDYYLTKSERLVLAEQVHPLLSTRGVPGTHDASLAVKQLSKLVEQSTEQVQLPRFDKSRDDRDEENPQIVEQPIQVIILEGWCLGAEPQTLEQLATPINALESEHDSSGEWRQFVNQSLTHYAELFALVDCWAMLKAPSFDCVYQWRLEQEQKMAAHLGVDFKSRDLSEHPDIMSSKELQHFIHHYQRITEHGLNTLPQKMHHLYELNQQRKIIRYSQPMAMK